MAEVVNLIYFITTEVLHHNPSPNRPLPVLPSLPFCPTLTRPQLTLLSATQAPELPCFRALRVPLSPSRTSFLCSLVVVVKSLSRVRLFATPWTVACQAPPSMGFSRQEYWSGLSFSSPGDLPDPGIEPGSPASQADDLPTSYEGTAGTNPLNPVNLWRKLADVHQPPPGCMAGSALPCKK